MRLKAPFAAGPKMETQEENETFGASVPHEPAPLLAIGGTGVSKMPAQTARRTTRRTTSDVSVR